MAKAKVKICGITNPDTINHSINPFIAKIDAIGLVFYEKSSRCVDINRAQSIISKLPPFINKVALFVNAKPSFIESVIKSTNIDTLQFHGNETPAQCEQYNMPFIRAIRMQADTNLEALADTYHRASGVLLDSYQTDSFGGTGESFDWALLQKTTNCITGIPVILAGGLNKNNVAKAIAKVAPYGVDVSSGVENAPGIKDIGKIECFLEACQ